MVSTRSTTTATKRDAPIEELPPKKRARTSKKSSQPAKKIKTDQLPAKEVSSAPEGDHEPGRPRRHNGDKHTSQIDRILQTYNGMPAFDDLVDPQQATSDTVLAHILHALMTSARISHSIATATVKKLLEAGYHKLETLEKSSWEERTEVLTDGGYTHYREKTATALGDLATFLREKYDGDVSKLVKVDDDTDVRTTVLKRIKEIKGIGDLGAEIFLESVQAAAPKVAPSLSKRNRETAEQLGLGDVDAIFEELHCDASSMAKFSQSLTMIRLEGKISKYA